MTNFQRELNAILLRRIRFKRKDPQSSHEYVPKQKGYRDRPRVARRSPRVQKGTTGTKEVPAPSMLSQSSGLFEFTSAPIRGCAMFSDATPSR